MKLLNPQEQAEKAVSYFEEGDLEKAAEEFSLVRNVYLSLNQNVKAAEMANNQSVVLLQLGKPQAALELVQGTDLIFQEANEKLLMAMSIGNLAACLEDLNQPQKAETEYKRCGMILIELDEDQLYAQTMKSLSALQLKNGKQLEALANMQIGFEGIKKPNLKQKLINTLLGLPAKLNKG